MKRVFRYKTVRFILSGGTATFVDISVYYICLHYIFFFDFRAYGFILSRPVESLIISYSCGFAVNFLISKFFVFKGSDLRTRHQLIRFAVVAILVFILNYILLKALIIYFSFYPTIARVVSAGTIALLSYFMHSRFTFSAKKNKKADI